MSKTWFITGTSRGFGREWAIAALERGDRVAATARNAESLDDLAHKYGEALLPIALDVTDREADFAAVRQAHDHFGGLDIVVNNAGYGHFGMVEEITEDEARAQIETNLFGALWVTQAALPLPARAGQRAHHPGLVDRRHLGVPVGWDVPRLQVGAGGLQPGAGPRGRRLRHPRDAGRAGRRSPPTGPVRPRSGRPSTRRTPRCTAPRRRPAPSGRATPGDPEATREAILRVVDAEEPPLRVFFGSAPLAIATADYEQRLRTWNEWQPVALIAQGDGPRER